MSRGGGYLYVPFFGGLAKHRFASGRERIEMDVGPQLAAVLEAAGAIEGIGSVEAEWSGDFDTVRLTLRSESFDGTFAPRAAFETYLREGSGKLRIKPGEIVHVVFRNSALAGITAKIRSFAFPEAEKDGRPGKANFVIRHAPDDDSSGMAFAVARFFSSAKTGPDASLKPRSICMDDGKGIRLEVSAEDREEFGRLTRRFIDAVNALRYPRYAPSPHMPPTDRKFYPFVRW